MPDGNITQRKEYASEKPDELAVNLPLRIENVLSLTVNN